MKSLTQRHPADWVKTDAVHEDTLRSSGTLSCTDRRPSADADFHSADPDSTADDGIPIVLAPDEHLSGVRSTSVVLAIDSRRAERAANDEALDDTTRFAPARGDAERSIGRIIGGRYLLGQVLGAGGMGTVFQATHTEIQKRVAIKVLASVFDRDHDAKECFRREAMTASALESEHIAQVFDVGEDLELGLYMVMEYLAGKDLARTLEEHGPLSPGAAASVVWQVCLALEHAHAAGVVHRDLKPANVFLTAADDGSVKVKVLDFGIAKRVHDARPSGAHAKDAIVGTPRYMSPEQAQGLASVNHLTDVYSLGSLLFEAIAATSPYPRLETSRETLDKILTEDPPRLGSRVHGAPPALDDLIAELMARDPARRPSSAREVRHRLAAICSELGSQPLAPSRPPPSLALHPTTAPVVRAPVVPARKDRDALVAVALSIATAGAVVGAILFALLAR